MNRNFWLIAGVVSAFVILLLAGVASSNNSAVNREEMINATKSDIAVKEKRRFDLITKLVQVVEQSSEYEKSTLVEVTKMRSAVESGNVEQATMSIKAIAEAYPVLQANQSFVALMNELAVTENTIAEARVAYNDSVKDYRRFVRRFPDGLFLSIAGHDVIDYQYLNFSADETALPDQLFEE